MIAGDLIEPINGSTKYLKNMLVNRKIHMSVIDVSVPMRLINQMKTNTSEVNKNYQEDLFMPRCTIKLKNKK